MRALVLHLKGQPEPVITTIQGDTSMHWTKDGISVGIGEENMTVVQGKQRSSVTFHRWESVVRVSIVDSSDICSRCGKYLTAPSMEVCFKCAELETMLNPISINTQRGQRQTSYLLEYAPSVPMQDIVDTWHGMYHPAGYDTRVVDKGNNEAGNRVVLVTRENSCD